MVYSKDIDTPKDNMRVCEMELEFTDVGEEYQSIIINMHLLRLQFGGFIYLYILTLTPQSNPENTLDSDF